MADEKRLPAHITEADVRLISEMVIPVAMEAQKAAMVELMADKIELTAERDEARAAIAEALKADEAGQPRNVIAHVLSRAHDFDQSDTRFGGGCMRCAALPGEDVPCEPPTPTRGPYNHDKGTTVDARETATTGYLADIAKAFAWSPRRAFHAGWDAHATTANTDPSTTPKDGQ